ncbi:TIGR02679 family protein [Streptomyces johnsoniae]|uniref:TIGR02679 family protein n=1 Tax=Streptomyces johnsoniae TaxID=3075532 RepID=A0ABU2S6Q6_9ACTN|nr:TIGR02679 family protein [Streptomyces sp. DSM 41886]MDT0443795.1 TIGR02679 family protein [Streptomyces sp. DSM 41886]
MTDGPAAVDLARLRRLLGTPELAWLVTNARRRMERGRPLTGTTTNAVPSEAQRAAAERLLGRAPQRGKALTVSLDAVDALLRRSEASPGGLPAAVVALTGPVEPRDEAARREARHWATAFAPLTALCEERPELASWYDQLQSSGLVRRLATTPDAAARLLADLTAVVSRLPAPATELSVFAARTLGDAHALDEDRPLATLTFQAIRALRPPPPGSGAAWRREVWASAGLLRDALSSTVLALGLPGHQNTATGRALAALREAGQPAVLTLRQLVRDPSAAHATGRVHVCENPSVVSAAADRLGPGCPPLVCVQGQPGTAALTLLRALATTGAELRYHGDFDWGGISIANTLLERVPWHPWRYTATDYTTAANHHPRARPLTGRPATATWDPALSTAMAAHGLAIEEELLLDTLLNDLGRAPGPS